MNLKNENVQASDVKIEKTSIEKVKIKEEKKEEHECETCNKTFSDSDNLKRHIMTFHCENMDNIKCGCGGCHKTFSGENHNLNSDISAIIVKEERDEVMKIENAPKKLKLEVQDDNDEIQFIQDLKKAF